MITALARDHSAPSGEVHFVMVGASVESAWVRRGRIRADGQPQIEPALALPWRSPPGSSAPAHPHADPPIEIAEAAPGVFVIASVFSGLMRLEGEQLEPIAGFAAQLPARDLLVVEAGEGSELPRDERSSCDAQRLYAGAWLGAPARGGVRALSSLTATQGVALATGCGGTIVRVEAVGAAPRAYFYDYRRVLDPGEGRELTRVASGGERIVVETRAASARCAGEIDFASEESANSTPRSRDGLFWRLGAPIGLGRSTFPVDCARLGGPQQLGAPVCSDLELDEIVPSIPGRGVAVTPGSARKILRAGGRPVVVYAGADATGHDAATLAVLDGNTRLRSTVPFDAAIALERRPGWIIATAPGGRFLVGAPCQR